MAMRKPKSRNARETSLRHVWLAGLGLVSVVRHDAVDAAGRLLGEMAGARQHARGVIAPAGSLMLAFARGARRRCDPVIGHFDDGIGARFAPSLRRQALRPRSMPGAGRKPAAKKRVHAARGRSRRGDSTD